MEKSSKKNNPNNNKGSQSQGIGPKANRTTESSPEKLSEREAVERYTPEARLGSVESGALYAIDETDSRDKDSKDERSTTRMSLQSVELRIATGSPLGGTTSRRSSQASSVTIRNESRVTRVGSETSRSESTTPRVTTQGRLKIKQVHCAWSSTTLSSAAATETSDDQLDDHINVVLRVRPLNSQEQNRNDTFCAQFHGGGRLEIQNFNQPKQFGYNVVFEPEASQEDVFDNSGMKKLIDMALNGYACTALAFGQTGSGKTHTMTGPPQQLYEEEFEGGKHPDPDMVGLMQRSFTYLLQQAESVAGNKVIRASYLEIYNEQVIDLLNPNQKRYLQVRWSKNKGFYVENLFVAECESVDDLMAVLEEGMRNRQTGSHGLNEFSSRSHSMLTLTIDTEQQDPDDENLYLTKRGKLTFVDLAGSEKVKDSESSDMTLKESNNINRSLLVLGNCISSLGDPKKRQGHIPYRDSKLTKLLADSLGGNGVTLMIACVTPSSHHVHETINTLRYASRAKKIKTKPIVKMDPREKLILSLKREIKILRNENGYLRQQLEFPAKPKGELQKSNDEKFMKFLKTQGKETNDPKTNVKGGTEEGLYEMLQEYMIENESLRTENSEMHQAKDKVKREQQLMYRENERLTKVIEKLEREINGRSGGGNGGWQRQPNGPPPQRQVNGPPPPRQVNGPPPPRQSGGPPPHQNLPPEQYYDQGPPPPRQGGNKPPPNNQWKGTPPQRPINNRPPPDQYIPGPSPQAGRGKQSTPPGGPKRPPHRLADPIARTANIPPEYIQNGIGGYPDDGYMSPRGRPSPLHNGPIRQGAVSSLLQDLRSGRFSQFSAGHRNLHQMHKIGYSMPNLSSRETHTADVGFSSASKTPYVRKIHTAIDIFLDEEDDRFSRIESPARYNDSRRSSQVSTSDSIRSMNAKLKQEIYDLEGEIEHHHNVNQRAKSIYGSQASMRSGPR
ncbi:kinesin-like protein KIF12 isoform X6 [Crassostrea angulata]|uniref:kinesin-like protein KIF12 isoform X6 n=1 Tax=Magallana angulata TaxID=2784310 RepID=UPI0022B11ADF|nr:kinesin-like protein KIF12 isoform X6 [Crassostrea angulata]